MTKVGESFVLCVSNDGYPVSLELRRVYRCMADEEAAGQGLLRVIDESGEDYLYPKELFETVTISESIRRR